MRTAMGPSTMVDNALSRYDRQVRAAVDLLDPRPPSEGFDPGTALPELDAALEDFHAASGISVAPLGDYRGRALTLLNLMHNPRTRTTKTYASLLIVARAIGHIRRTGGRVMILTPSSANKATALRDAVLRALERSLVTSDQIQIAVVVPRESLGKMWGSPLDEDPDLRGRNPVFVAGGDPEGVKAIARTFCDTYGDRIQDRSGASVWYTMSLDNYRMADSVRAFFESEAFPPEPGRTRVHAHAVSSAFGLLGYELGRRVLATGSSRSGDCPRFYLVQHLRTPDMVLSLLNGSFARTGIPAYRRDPATGMLVQDAHPAFPYETDHPEDSIDPTFYTRRPLTSGIIDEIVARCGGGGIVVSRRECLRRYGEVAGLLAPAGVHLPADPDALREWALLMAMTGVLNGIDRGLIPEGADVVVHGSGSYGAREYRSLDPAHTSDIEGPEDMLDTVERALGGP
jgi:Family of unknown function (DUF6002)